MCHFQLVCRYLIKVKVSCKAIVVHMQASKSLLTEGLQPSNICLDVYSSKKSLRRANYRIAPSCGGGRHHSTGSGLAEQTARCEPPHGVTVHVLQHLGRECCVNVQHVHPILRNFGDGWGRRDDSRFSSDGLQRCWPRSENIVGHLACGDRVPSYLCKILSHLQRPPRHTSWQWLLAVPRPSS